MQIILSVKNFVTAWTVTYHRNLYTKLFFNKLNISLSFLREFIVVLNASNVTLPTWESFIYRLSLIELISSKEICINLAFVFVTSTNMESIHVTKYIKTSHTNFCSTLNFTAVTSSNSIKIAYASRSTSCCTKFALISAFSSKFISFFAKEFTNKWTFAYS